MINKKGSITTTVIFIASISAMAIFLLIVGYLGNTVGSQILTKLNEDNSHSEATNATIGATVNVSNTMLGPLWFIVFGGLLLGVIVTATMIRSYPVLLPVFLFLLIVTVILGVVMSNAYEMLADNATLSTAASQQGAVGFMMNKLPYISFIIGLISVIIIFAKPKEAVIM